MTHAPTGATPHLILLASFFATLLLQLALALCTRAGRRLPAALWLAPVAGVVVAGREVTHTVADAARAQLAHADPATIVAEGAHAWSTILMADGIGYALASVALLLTAWLSAVGHVAGAGRHAHPRWSRAAPSLLVALAGAGALGGLGYAVEAPMAGLAPASALLVGLLASTLAAPWRSTDARDDQRLCAGRGLAMGSTMLAVLAAATGALEVVRAGAWSRVAVSDPELRTAVLASVGELSRTTAGLGVLGAGIAAAAGASAVLLAPRGFGTWRTVLSALAAAALMVGTLGWRVVDAFSLADVAVSAQGGAVARQPLVRLADLPRAEDLTGRAPATPVARGTCLVVEGAEGWHGEPLHPLLDTEGFILAHGAKDRPVEELERHPGCPDDGGPLPGPLSTHELPVVAVQAGRLAPAVTGYRWFLQRGVLRLLLAPPEGEAGVAPWARAWRTVDLHWEMPPEDERVGDGDDRWDYDAAVALPVTLMEGAAPVLIAGGSREYLPEGREGAARLRDALLGAEERDLVLVPRKHWTVQDLVRFCLTVKGHVEGARCVVRPESPVRWSERTGLPLPWEVPD